MNLQSTKETIGSKVQTTDKQFVGHVSDYYFSPGPWRIDYIVVDARKWLNGKLLLISPRLFHFDPNLQILTVYLTKEQVRESPILSQDDLKQLGRPLASEIGFKLADNGPLQRKT
jgi:hypothetical protein